LKPIVVYGLSDWLHKVPQLSAAMLLLLLLLWTLSVPQTSNLQLLG
jgi:hypothetical protein